MEKTCKKKLKRILVLFVAILICMSPVQMIYAADTTAPERTEESSGPAVGKTDSLAELPEEWAKFRNLYYYNRIPEKQKVLYRQMDRVCASYLSDRNITEDGEQYNGDTYMEIIKTGELTLEQIQETVDLFINDNPQYFFVRNGYIYDISMKEYENLRDEKREQNVGIGLLIYIRFADGTERQKAAEKLLKKADAVIRNANKKKTADEKIRYVHDFLIRHTTYIQNKKDEEKELTQSAFSALCKKRSVCAGYSRAFSMLCNGLGYKTICLTGGENPGHMWNMTYIRKKWYNFDVTWDDLDVDGFICTDWFARSDREFSRDSGKNHVPEEFLKKYVPKAVKDRKNEEKI